MIPSCSRLKAFLLLLLGFIGSQQTHGQTIACPPNIDFEFGTFQHWGVFSGQTSESGGQNVINVSSTLPIANRHTIFSAATQSTLRDPYGNFPVVCPNGSGFSVKLGNSSSNRKADRISYTFTIPPGENEYSIVYQYAVVLEDPNHTPSQQPRFTAKVYDVATGAFVGCGGFDHVATRGLPGFQQAPGFSQVWYKDWAPITLNLNGFGGRSVRLEFTTADCTLGAHFGYAYIDVNIGCTSPVRGAYFCPGADTVKLTAPFGYKSYTWYDSAMTQVLGNQSTLIISPPPAVNTVYALDIEPYPNLGCRDTVYATIRPAVPPAADAGPDQLVCTGSGTSIGTPSVPGMEYSWTPLNGLTSGIVATPTASPPATTQYFLKVTDPFTGCTAKDSTVVSISSLPQAAFTVNSSSQCIGSDNFQFTYTNPSNAPNFFWRWGNGQLGSGLTPTYSYGAIGNYTVTLVASSAGGCTDSTTQNLTVHALPSGTLTGSDTKICEGIPTALTATGGTRYNWFRDGAAISGTAATNNALQPGTYTVEIVDANACKNMAANSVVLGFVRKPSAAFSFDPYCLTLPVNFNNSSNVAGSGNVTYQWNFGDTITASDKDPVHLYRKAGTYDVELKVTPDECPAIATTLVKELTIEAPVPGIQYVAQNAVINKDLQLRARNLGRNYQWSPGTSLSSTTSANPMFKGDQEQRYTITFNTPSGCTTVDTLLVRMFKEREIYVPTAFTPNGDGQNDRIYPFLVGIKQLRSFRIINRWGVVVYESRTDLPGWDGNYGGTAQPMGAYVWECQATDIYGQTIVRKGNFTLIR